MDANIQNYPIEWIDPEKPLNELWNDACLNPEFVSAAGVNITPTPEDEKQARAIVFQTPSAPQTPTTPGAALAVRRLLARYDFSLADEASRLRTYTISRLLDLAESEKESIALGALEKIGKIAEVGLFETRISVDIGKKSTKELEEDLQSLLGKYLKSTSIDGELA